MANNKSWKKAAAFILALTMVCSSVPASFGALAADVRGTDKGLTLAAGTEKTKYTVQVFEAENGKVSVDKTELEKGEKFTIIPAADDGYEVDKIYVNGEQAAINDQGRYEVEMPGEDVAVMVEFKKINYTVTIDDKVKNGKLSVQEPVIEWGEEFAIIPAPDEGYAVKSVTADGQAVEPNEYGVYIYTMPKKNITVSAEFEQADSEALKEYEKHRENAKSAINALVTADDDEGAKIIAEGAVEALDGCAYISTFTLEQNKAHIDKMVNDIKQTLEQYREYKKYAKDFSEYLEQKRKQIHEMQNEDYSVDLNEWIEEQADSILDTVYNTDISFEDNKKAVDDIVEDIRKAIIRQNANDILTESVRIFGNDRYETSLKTADRFMQDNKLEKLPALVIATGRDYADALSAAYLARVKNAPIILTDTNNDAVVDTTLEYIHKNCDKNTKVYIVGGEGAVSYLFQKKLTTSAPIEQQYDVVRLQGDDRYLTNLEILKEAGVKNEELIVASGSDFADAVSASSAARPMLLVSGKTLTAEQQAFVKELGSEKAYIAGGTGAVSADIETQLKGTFKQVTRLGGKNRYETSTLIAAEFCPRTDVIALAYGLNFPDGIAGAPLAMLYGAPIVLATDNDISQAADYAKEAGAEKYVVFGGTALISDKSAKSVTAEDEMN